MKKKKKTGRVAVPKSTRREFRLLQEHYPALREWRLISLNVPSGYGGTQVMGVCVKETHTIVLMQWMWKLNGKKHPVISDVLRHECAHALLGEQSSIHLHDRVWRKMAKLLGASPYANYRGRKLKTPR
jgi:hypothetical protein